MNSPIMTKRIDRIVAGLPALLFLLAVLLPSPKPANAIPAFARKYGLPCSACHIGWPELNNFGQVFRDNGYQMMNERDSPITRDPSYFPMTMRITPQWHRESANNQVVDNTPGDSEAGSHAGTLSTAGIDLSGIDVWFAGTLYKNISFSLLPTIDSDGTVGIENAFVRFDNLLHSPWLNFKIGKFELDLPVSEKRMLNLSGDGGFYNIFHFVPFGDANPFGGIGDNQIGMELAGHNANSYTRYAFAALSSVDGNPGLTYSNGQPASRTFDYYGHFEQGFNTFGNGFMKVGAYSYFGYAPTFFETSGGTPIYGRGNEPFYRAGAEWKWYFSKFLVKAVYMHAYDNAFLANAVPSNSGPLPEGDRAVKWNGGFLEGQYIISPQWIIVGRWETIHMAQQANTEIPGDTGNLNAFTIANRWYPIMFSRAGLALIQEYSWNRSNGITNQGGALGSACGDAGLPGTCKINSSSIMFGFDFDF
ncbi:MAG: hypothetical protein WB987_16510 [Candidatus Acidiferrales bacterium]